jgi:hypothetical protein
VTDLGAGSRAIIGRVARTEDDERERFEVELSELRAMLARPSDFADDAAREHYSSMLDRYGDDAARLARLREVAVELHRLEQEGVLPRSMVVRSKRRRE